MKLPFSLWSDDIGKNVYKVTQTYTLIVEQYVKAHNKDEAFDVVLNKGGVNHDKIDKFLTNEDFEFCETTFVDVDSPETDIQYQGAIVKDDEDVKCDFFEPEFKDAVVPFNKKFGRHA
jgi:hypothetical protein